MIDAEPRHVVRAADVARAAGVSVATVSLVVNGKADGRVSVAKQQRVREAVDRFGYRVDRRASRLAGGRAGAVSLLVPDLDSPFYSQVTAGVQEVLGDDTDLSLVLTGHHPARIARGIDRALAGRADGLLLGGVGAGVLDGGRARLPVPVVVMDHPGGNPDLTAAGFDLRAGCIALAEHLAAHDHQRVAYLDGHPYVPTFRERHAYLEAGLVRAGGAEITVTLRSDTTAGAAGAVVRRSWPQMCDAEVTALVCATDIQAYGALQALFDLGVQVPGQLSLASFDDLPFSRLITPALTTVALPARELGRVAATSLLDAIERDGVPPSPALVPTSLSVRRTTGPAPAGPRA
jgi:LacI family transcriptional regulator